MNPTLAEDIMRKRAFRSAIVLVTSLACVLFATDRASADGVTVIVPVNVTNLHEDIEKVYVRVRLFHETQEVGRGQSTGTTVVDRSVQQDEEISIRPYDWRDPRHQANENFLNADTYEIMLLLKIFGVAPICFVDGVDKEYESDHVCGGERTSFQTYARLEGPISDLTPE